MGGWNAIDLIAAFGGGCFIVGVVWLYASMAWEEWRERRAGRSDR